MHATAWRPAMAAPASTAETSPTHGLPAYHVTAAAVNAPASISPSSAMLMTPARSEKSPPSAASRSGVAKRRAERSRPKLKMSVRFIAVRYLPLDLGTPQHAEPVRHPAEVDPDGDEEDDERL